MATKTIKTTAKKGSATRAKGSGTVNQTFCFKSPGAVSVAIAGDFTHWQKEPIPMKRDETGVWTATVPLPPGTYHYRFIADGQWMDDPECTLRIATPFGSENSVRVVL